MIEIVDYLLHILVLDRDANEREWLRRVIKIECLLSSCKLTLAN